MIKRFSVVAMMFFIVSTVNAQVQGTAFWGTGTDSNSYFMGPVSIGTSNAPTEKLYVNGDASIQGAVKVPKQGDVSMGPYTNGVSTAGLTASNLAVQGHWISFDGENEGIFVTTNGYVGIGTNGVGSPLTVNGTIESKSGGFKFPDGSIQGSAVAFTNTVGGQAYANSGFTLAGGSNASIRLSNGVHYVDSSGQPFVNTVGTQNYVNAGVNIQASGNISITHSNGASWLHAAGTDFTNTLGGHSYVNLGINLQAGSNMMLRTDNNGTNYYIDHISPMFRATKTTNQTFSEEVWTKVVFPNTNILVNIGGMFEPTNSRVTILSPGRYSMSVQLGISESGDKAMGSIYKNGTNFLQSAACQTSADTNPERVINIVSPVMNVVSGDYFEVFYYEITGASGGILGVPGFTWWAGWRAD